MRKLFFGLASLALTCLFLALTPLENLASANPQDGGLRKKDRDGKDDVVGTIWKYKATHQDRKINGQFRVHNHVVYRGKNKVGKIVPQSPTETTMLITDYAELNGTIKLRKTETKPPVWTGFLTKPNGNKWKIEVEIKDQ